MTLSVSNFFRFYMFHPEQAPSNGDRVIAMITTIALGVFTLGLTHLICYVGFYHSLKNKSVEQHKQNTEEEKKVKRVYEETSESVEKSTPSTAPPQGKIDTYYLPVADRVEITPDSLESSDMGKFVKPLETSVHTLEEEVDPEVIPMDIDEEYLGSGEEEADPEVISMITSEEYMASSEEEQDGLDISQSPDMKLDESKPVESKKPKNDVFDDPIFLEDYEDIRDKAEGGKPEYQYALGCLYLFGEKGLKLSKMKAKFWIRRAAEAGCHKAMYQLAKIYYDDSAKDDKLLQDAEEWFRKGSRYDPRAAYWLAKFYEEGIVVEKSKEEADILYNKAAEGGFPG